MLDSHAHILSRDTIRFPPAQTTPESLELLNKNAFPAEELLAAMDATGVQRALLVQRGQIYGADNSLVCHAAMAHPDRLRAVCAINTRTPDCLDAARSWLDAGAVGLRLMGGPQEPGLEWLAGESARAVWRLCADRGATLCVHLFRSRREEGLAQIMALLDTFALPTLVIDHLTNALIDDASGGIDPALQQLSQRANVVLKFTTIPLGDLRQRGIDSGAVLAAYVGQFGSDRLIWGSDITQSPGSYSDMVALAREATSGLPGEVQRQLLGENAARIYGWP
jgi:predicted TIM-barrel fold metal-dependent hydrolase